MNKWIKVLTGSVYILLIISVLINLSQAGYLPSIVKPAINPDGLDTDTPAP